MTPDNQPRWYIYHVVGKELVLDRAHHTDHLKQHHRNTGLPPPKFLAGDKSPMDQDYLKRLAESRGLTLNLSPRQPISAYAEPADITAKRAKNEALRAARKAGK